MIKTEIEGHDITLKAYENGTFVVIYGLQVSKCDSYGAAIIELGGCLMHSLACEGRIPYNEDEKG